MKFTNEDLKNCPFCGGKAVTMAEVTQMGGGVDVIDFTVACVNCRVSKTVSLKIDGSAPFTDIVKVIGLVVDKWNSRV